MRVTVARLVFELLWVLGASASPPLPWAPIFSNSSQWINLIAVGTGPVQEHGVAATSDDLYIIGGISTNATTPIPPSRRDVSAYNFKTSMWRTAAPIPVGMTHANAAAVDGKIYVLGGLTGNDHDPVWLYTTACFVYDPKIDKWTTLPSMPED
ncbi:hypothetical protein F5Y10DRAFT_293920 [Nemania abortiva]|nr:hypothetical protein F5Y10DRAFT_293920 [Nemania abortiva]